jgi:hypothetical protein
MALFMLTSENLSDSKIYKMLNLLTSILFETQTRYLLDMSRCSTTCVDVTVDSCRK